MPFEFGYAFLNRSERIVDNDLTLGVIIGVDDKLREYIDEGINGLF